MGGHGGVGELNNAPWGLPTLTWQDLQRMSQGSLWGNTSMGGSVEVARPIVRKTSVAKACICPS